MSTMKKQRGRVMHAEVEQQQQQEEEEEENIDTQNEDDGEDNTSDNDEEMEINLVDKNDMETIPPPRIPQRNSDDQKKINNGKSTLKRVRTTEETNDNTSTIQEENKPLLSSKEETPMKRSKLSVASTKSSTTPSNQGLMTTTTTTTATTTPNIPIKTDHVIYRDDSRSSKKQLEDKNNLALVTVPVKSKIESLTRSSEDVIYIGDLDVSKLKLFFPKQKKAYDRTDMIIKVKHSENPFDREIIVRTAFAPVYSSCLHKLGSMTLESEEKMRKMQNGGGTGDNKAHVDYKKDLKGARFFAYLADNALPMKVVEDHYPGAIEEMKKCFQKSKDALKWIQKQMVENNVNQHFINLAQTEAEDVEFNEKKIPTKDYVERYYMRNKAFGKFIIETGAKVKDLTKGLEKTYECDITKFKARVCLQPEQHFLLSGYPHRIPEKEEVYTKEEDIDQINSLDHLEICKESGVLYNWPRITDPAGVVPKMGRNEKPYISKDDIVSIAFVYEPYSSGDKVGIRQNIRYIQVLKKNPIGPGYSSQPQVLRIEDVPDSFFLKEEEEDHQHSRYPAITN